MLRNGTSLVLSVIVTLAGIAADSTSRRPSTLAGDRFGSLDSSAAREYAEAVRHLTTPQLEERKRVRRDYQRRHYAEVLYEEVQMDAAGALLAAVRSRAQLDIALPHNTLFISLPVNQPPPPGLRMPGTTAQPSGPFVLPLYKDFGFPADPWTR